MYQDILFLLIIFSLFFLYKYFNKNMPIKKNIIDEDVIKNINASVENKYKKINSNKPLESSVENKYLIFETDKYKEKDDDLPWDNLNEDCAGKSIDTIQNMVVTNLQSNRKITIY
jgi:hypothetical protein